MFFVSNFLIADLLLRQLNLLGLSGSSTQEIEGNRAGSSNTVTAASTGACTDSASTSTLALAQSQFASQLSQLKEPPKKKPSFGLFGYKKPSTQQSSATLQPEVLLKKYIDKINSDNSEDELENEYTLPQYKPIWPLFASQWCTPATSAPVERIFSQSGIIMRPHRAKMSNKLLEALMFLKCN